MYCRICGAYPEGKESFKTVSYFDPDDGWRRTPLCKHCVNKYAREDRESSDCILHQDHLNIKVIPIHDESKVARVMAVLVMEDQLIRRFGEPPGSSFFEVVSSGYKVSLRLFFRPDDSDESQYAGRVKSGQPEHWDDESRAKLSPFIECS